MDNITKKINEVLLKYNYKLYSVKYKTDTGIKILEVLIDEVLTYDELEPLHNDVLDAINDNLGDDDYLELSTVGAEKPINNVIEAKLAIDQLIYIKSDFYKGNAYLVDVNEELDQITIEVLIKTVRKQFKIKFNQLSELRYAVSV